MDGRETHTNLSEKGVSEMERQIGRETDRQTEKQSESETGGKKE